MTRPQRRHLLIDPNLGASELDTACNIVVQPVRNAEEKITHFVTFPAANTIQCVTDPRDVNCNTCQHVWRNIKGEANG